ncbi:MAG: CoA transferase [Clostridium sp.]|nr:CoA transferase [Clostridium sp.]
MTKALSGITVIDLTESVAGPYCTMMMGDLGAEVIKVEPAGGDVLRSSAPLVNGGNPVFTAFNRNKKSIVIDLSLPEGIALLKKLLAGADVLIDSFLPGTMEQMGLDYDSLKEEFPKLICASLTGFGPEGPYRGRPVYEGTLQAECGMTQSLVNDSKGTPYYVGGRLTQYASAYFLLTAVLAAVHQSRETGRGQRIDANMYGSLLAMFSLPINDYVFNGVECPIDGNAPEGFIRSSDGWLRITCGDQPIWERTIKLLDDPVMNEPRFMEASVRNENRELLLDRMEQWSLKRTSREAVELFTEAGISGGIVRTFKELRSDPHLIARKSFVDIDVKGLGPLPYFASPFRIRGMETEYNPAPEAGENTEEILSSRLSLGKQEIADLKAGSIVA